jgi:hypothetical protein
MSAQRAAENPLAGAANLRGGLLIAVAVIVGVVLLGKGFDTGVVGSSGGDPSDEVATGDDGAGSTDEGGGADGTTTTTPVTHPVAEVRVQVLNSTGPSGSAGTATTTISAQGYVTLDPDNATDRNATATAIFAQPGYEADAAAIAAVVGITAAVQPMPAPPPAPAPIDANIVIVLGPDFGAAATTTTAVAN